MNFKAFFVIFCFGLVGFSSAAPIIPKSIKASSTLDSTENETFDASNLLDNNLKTVWAAPIEDNTLTLTLEVDAFTINSLRILNGYRRTKDAYESYGRAAFIKIFANDKKHLVKTEMLSNYKWEYAMGEQTYKGCIAYLKEKGKLFKDVEFDLDTPCEKDDMECWGKRRFLKDHCKLFSPKKYYQEIFFSKPLKDVKKLIIDIESTYPGNRDVSSLAITEISLDGHPTNPLKKGFKPKFGSFKDKRDGRKYKTVEIGEETWMAEYLRYDTKDTSCTLYHGNVPCNENAEYRKGSISDFLCPAGWRLPTEDDVVVFAQTVKSYYEDPTIAIKDIFDSKRSSRSFDLSFWNKTSDVVEIYDEVTESERLDSKFGRHTYPEPSKSALWLAPIETDSGKVVTQAILYSGGDVGGDDHSWSAYVRCIKK